MKIGEVSSMASVSNVSSYQGQGSPRQTAPVSEVPKPSKETADTNDVNNGLSNVANSSNVIPSNKNDDEFVTEEKEQKRGPSQSVRDAVEKINSASQNYEAVFGIHEDTNRVMIKMVDKETKEVLKEFPAEETLDLIAKAWELAGIMVDERR